MGQPVTTNPFVIMLINMTVVFAVLWGLSLLVRLIKIIDPTKKKILVESEPVPADIPIAATSSVEADETIILIAAALAAYGYSPSQIVSIRPVGGVVWTQTARVEAVQQRTQMF